MQAIRLIIEQLGSAIELLRTVGLRSIYPTQTMPDAIYSLRLGIPIFIATGVEMIEALTIVLAIGVSRGWRSAIAGGMAAIVTLTGLVMVFGPALSQAPLKLLWLVFGGLLTVFGLQWMRKAILRYAGQLSIHDEAAVYRRVKTEAKQAGGKSRDLIDWYGFVVVFKGVFLEGIEVVFVVLAFGASAGRVGVGVYSAAAALVIVLGLGLILHRPLTRLPENTMKFSVGLVLAGFGTFFGAAGAGVHWPHGETAIIFITGFYLLASLAVIAFLKGTARPKKQLMTKQS